MPQFLALWFLADVSNKCFLTGVAWVFQCWRKSDRIQDKYSNEYSKFSVVDEQKQNENYYNRMKILLLNVNLALLSIYFIYLYRKFVQFSLRKFRFVSNRIPLRSLRRYRNFWPVFFRSEKFNLILNCISCGNLQFKLWDLKFLQSMSLNVDTKLVVLIETYLQWEEKSWVWDTSSDRLRNQLQIQLE